MVEEVDPHRIETLVQATRREHEHVIRWVSEQDMVYILHSRECREKDYPTSLLHCPYTLALSEGSMHPSWEDFKDVPVISVLNSPIYMRGKKVIYPDKIVEAED